MFQAAEQPEYGSFDSKLGSVRSDDGFRRDARGSFVRSGSDDGFRRPSLSASFDVLYQSHDDLQALRHMLASLDETAMRLSKEELIRPSKPMPCHICERLVKREHYDSHTDMCVEMGRITDSFRETLSLLRSEVTINALIIPTPTLRSTPNLISYNLNSDANLTLTLTAMR